MGFVVFKRLRQAAVLAQHGAQHALSLLVRRHVFDQHLLPALTLRRAQRGVSLAVSLHNGFPAVHTQLRLVATLLLVVFEVLEHDVFRAPRTRHLSARTFLGHVLL
jgi:hypothetical protein